LLSSRLSKRPLRRQLTSLPPKSKHNKKKKRRRRQRQRLRLRQPPSKMARRLKMGSRVTREALS
jgi:hypothetical protein